MDENHKITGRAYLTHHDGMQDPENIRDPELNEASYKVQKRSYSDVQDDEPQNPHNKANPDSPTV